jgi:hypothetical protein
MSTLIGGRQAAGFVKRSRGSSNRLEVMCAKVEGSLRGANAAPILNATV